MGFRLPGVRFHSGAVFVERLQGLAVGAACETEEAQREDGRVEARVLRAKPVHLLPCLLVSSDREVHEGEKIVGAGVRLKVGEFMRVLEGFFHVAAAQEHVGEILVVARDGRIRVLDGVRQPFSALVAIAVMSAVVPAEVIIPFRLQRVDSVQIFQEVELGFQIALDLGLPAQEDEPVALFHFGA